MEEEADGCVSCFGPPHPPRADVSGLTGAAAQPGTQ